MQVLNSSLSKSDSVAIQKHAVLAVSELRYLDLMIPGMTIKNRQYIVKELTTVIKSSNRSLVPSHGRNSMFSVLCSDNKR